MRTLTAVRLDTAHVDQARRRAGLPAGVPTSAVLRYALAMLAGADTAAALDTTPGRGSVSHRGRVAA